MTHGCMVAWLQRFGCRARIEVVHHGSGLVSDVFVTNDHCHDHVTDNFVIFKDVVVDKMKELCGKGLPPQAIRAGVVDDLLGGDDAMSNVPTLRQV